jgi:hypothetical protein
MKYHLFAGDDYYPNGGADDHKQSADTVEELLEVAANMTCDWWHITDDELSVVRRAR